MVAVVGAFPSVEGAVAALPALKLAAEGRPPRLTALVRSGGQHLPPAPGLRWVRAADGDGVQDATETATAGALLGVFIAGVLANAPGIWVFTHLWITSGPERAVTWGQATLPLPLFIVALTLGAAAGMWAGRKFGLPRELAYRYGLHLRRGRVVVGLCVPGQQAPAAVAALQSAGAVDVRVGAGRLRLRPGATPDSLDLPASAVR